MKKKYSLVYLSTCLPDYFLGYDGEVLAVALSERPRTSEVRNGLLDSIQAYGLDSDESAQLRDSAEELFMGMDLRRRWSLACGDLSESYAHFGIKVVEVE